MARRRKGGRRKAPGGISKVAIRRMLGLGAGRRGGGRRRVRR